MIGETLFQVLVLSTCYALALMTSPLARSIGAVPVHSNDREPHLDGMRGLAAVGVVACHVNQYMVSFWGFENPTIGNHVGILCVQLFFALTAFLFTTRALNAKLSPERFYVGRIKRIVPLYLAVSVGALAIAWFFSREANVPVAQMAFESIQCLSFGFWKTDAITFRGVNMLSLVGIAWTLSYEWAFYLLLVPVYFLWRTGRVATIAIIVVIVILAARDFAIQGEQVIWPFFLPGIVVALLQERLVRINRTVLLALSVPAIVVIFWLPGYWTALKLGTIVIVFCAIAIGQPRWLAWRPLRTLGEISYSIYLTQYLVLFSAMQVVLASPHLTSIEVRLATGGVVVVATVMLSAVTYRFVERPWLEKKAATRPGTMAGENFHNLESPSRGDVYLVPNEATSSYRL